MYAQVLYQMLHKIVIYCTFTYLELNGNNAPINIYIYLFIQKFQVTRRQTIEIVCMCMCVFNFETDIQLWCYKNVPLYSSTAYVYHELITLL